MVESSQIGHDLEEVTFTPKYDFKISLTDLPIQGTAGVAINIPRWAAEILEKDGHGEINEAKDMLQEVIQAITKENFQENELATLTKDFFIRVKSYQKRLPDADRERLESQLRTLVRKRLGKLIPIAHMIELSPDIRKKLTNEEIVLYDSIFNKSKEFQEAILGLFKS